MLRWKFQKPSRRPRERGSQGRSRKRAFRSERVCAAVGKLDAALELGVVQAAVRIVGAQRLRSVLSRLV